MSSFLTMLLLCLAENLIYGHNSHSKLKRIRQDPVQKGFSLQVKAIVMCVNGPVVPWFYLYRTLATFKSSISVNSLCLIAFSFILRVLLLWSLLLFSSLRSPTPSCSFWVGGWKCLQSSFSFLLWILQVIFFLFSRSFIHSFLFFFILHTGSYWGDERKKRSFWRVSQFLGNWFKMTHKFFSKIQPKGSK